ncbi:TonB-dependent receptor [Wenzhouxiangella sp. XN79A]|uniref:TonB-dependent receptor plug domain-containing protein n=1 Tax=Wenzhouxiangella sp. XN79A TaxID=2724193 RepID=UPI00144AE581|nr:TonB-dependent receptor [Wenzhouxiangella sp. XN79A]NKI35016.1 TonB-dependent receptor [Wenzhouxiangella sp. XN79A]
MKDIRNPLAAAIHYALGAGVVAGLAVTAAPAFAQDEEAADLDRVEVTGSRIKRTDIEGALPVTVIDREQIEFSGKTSVADLLRDTPFNSAGSFRPQSGSSAQSFAGVSLRALGSGRTLVLIDGKRAPVAPNVGAGQDLNSIPLAAVERIEILSDGASAIYGSDAIGGVINIITRKDFTGVELTWGTSDPKRPGGDREEASAIFGVSGDRGQIMVGVSYDERDIVFARDRPWSQGGASIFSNNFLTSGFSFLGGQGPNGGPGNVAGCNGPGFVLDGGFCFYDFTLQSADEAATRNESLFTRSRYDINADWSVFMNAQVNRVKTFGRYAPVPSSPWLVGGFGAIVLEPGTPNHPATPPSAGGLNPFFDTYQGVADDIVLLTHRFAANGPRDTSTDAQLYDVDLGAQGRIGNFDVEFGMRRTESQYTEIGRNYIVSALAQPQITNGNYNIYDPFNVPQDILQSFTSTIGRDANYLAKEFYANAATDLFDVPAGTVGLAFGAEYREEDYRDIYDDLQANGNITGSAGNSASGGRDLTAVFAEVLVPILDNLELSGALRYDDYSDFGDATSPKLALRYQPLDILTLRASWGEGFRAPTLDILSARPSFSADSVIDDPTCVAFGQQPGCETQITAFVISNPNLDAEDSEQFNIGAAFEPFDWLSGSVDWWKIEVTNRVAAIGAQQIINCLNGTSQNCPPGLSNLDPSLSPPNETVGQGLGVARNPDTGQIVYLQRGFASLGTIDTEGFDVNLRGNWNFGELGSLRVDAQGTYTATFEVDSGANVAGDAGLPRWRAALNTEYRIGDFAFAWVMNYIDDQNDALDPNLDGLPSWTTHDLQANWYTPWNGQITVGVDNVANKDPVLDPGEGRGFNFSLYDGYGRIPYVRYKQSF